MCGVTGGSLACEGAMRLQSLHSSRVLEMQSVIPGQNSEDLALDVIEEVPWCAACKAESTFDLSDGGISTRLLYIITPSTIYRLSLCL